MLATEIIDWLGNLEITMTLTPRTSPTITLLSHNCPLQLSIPSASELGVGKAVDGDPRDVVDVDVGAPVERAKRVVKTLVLTHILMTVIAPINCKYYRYSSCFPYLILSTCKQNSQHLVGSQQPSLFRQWPSIRQVHNQDCSFQLYINSMPQRKGHK